MTVIINHQNKINNRHKGQIIEDLAANYLQRHGLLILERNFVCKIGEIDLICQDNTELVFVEVRYRHNTTFGTPIESINYKKQQKLIAVATTYIQAKFINQTEPVYRFDVIGINGNLASPEIEWLSNVIFQ